MPDHEGLRILTARQHGVVGRRQLADLGFSKQAVAHAVATGRLVRLSPRVLLLGGSPSNLEQRAMAAVLDVPGGAVSLSTAASFWGVAGFAPEPVHVLTDRRPHRGGRTLGRVHITVRLCSTEVTTIGSIPVTSPVRTLRDLSSRVPFGRLAAACDRMASLRVLRYEELAALGTSLPERGGPPGTSSLRRLVEERPVGTVPSESNLERRFERILADAGEAGFERQVDLGDDEGWIGRVDVLDRRARLVVEVQSRLHHSSLTDRRRDAHRIARLEAAGWRVLEIDEDEIWHRPDMVVAKVRAARRRAAA
jgi:very-short-patch-repair endonuclease